MRYCQASTRRDRTAVREDEGEPAGLRSSGEAAPRDLQSEAADRDEGHPAPELHCQLIHRSAGEVLSFLKKQQTKNLNLRLTASKGVLTEYIQDFHEDIAQLFKLLNVAHLNALTQLQQQQQFDIASGTTDLLKELHDQEA